MKIKESLLSAAASLTRNSDSVIEMALVETYMYYLVNSVPEITIADSANNSVETHKILQSFADYIKKDHTQFIKLKRLVAIYTELTAEERLLRIERLKQKISKMYELANIQVYNDK